MKVPSWELAAAAKRSSLDHQINAYAGDISLSSTDAIDVSKLNLELHLSARELSITVLNAEDLLPRLASGSLSSEEVIKAFCRRAIIAHGLVNCLCEVFFDKALLRARQLDDHLKRTGIPVGPLHGLPISLKNQCSVEDVEMNMCYVGQIGSIAKENSNIAKVLLGQGAVLYTLTNLSQGLLSTDTVNNLYGRTLNPFNRRLVAGGSSGGEGALIAIRGSVVGIGSDLGGSIRVPAAFNGVYGLRPSSHRVPYGGSTNSQQGQETNASCLGPISSSCEGLKILFKAIVDARPWCIDAMALRMPWNESMYQLEDHGGGRGLCFAIAWDDGQVVPHPPYHRALRCVQQALRTAGHTTIDWRLPNSHTGLQLYMEILTADGGQDVARHCATSGEPILGGTAKGFPSKHRSTAEWWDLSYRRRVFVQDQVNAWNETVSITGTGRAIDAIIMPVAPYASFKPGEREYVYYTSICNLCDFPTATFPVTRVDSTIDLQHLRQSYLSEWDRNIYERYDPETFAGLPVGLQLVGRKGEDEAVLGMLGIVSNALAPE